MKGPLLEVSNEQGGIRPCKKLFGFSSEEPF